MIHSRYSYCIRITPLTLISFYSSNQLSNTVYSIFIISLSFSPPLHNYCNPLVQNLITSSKHKTRLKSLSAFPLTLDTQQVNLLEAQFCSLTFHCSKAFSKVILQPCIQILVPIYTPGTLLPPYFLFVWSKHPKLQPNGNSCFHSDI